MKAVLSTCVLTLLIAIACLGFAPALQAQTLTVSCATAIAEVGVPYSSAVTASGGTAPYTFSITTGALPPGLSLNTSTGAITGTPSEFASFNYTVKAVDAKGSSATAHCKIKVYEHVSIDCPTKNTGAVGVPFSEKIATYPGVAPYTYALIAGSLPPGLTLNTSTAVISGTPTTAGSFFFTIEVTDSLGGTFVLKCSIKITKTPPITLSCPPGTPQVGVPYDSALVATGGIPPYTFSIISGSLPPGLTLNPSTGAITGTPTSFGSYSFTAQVVDSTGSQAGTATTTCSLIVTPPAIHLACPSGTAQVGVPYSSALVATGGAPPYTFSITAGSLPPGLTLNPSTGAITGTPTTYGSYTFTAQVVDSRNNSAGTTTASCTIVVAPPALTLVCPSGTGQVGVPYSSALVATGGEPPYTYSIITGSLPPGLTLNPSTGAITGTPTTYGSYTFTAQVVDSRNNSAGTTTASCTIVVAPPTLTLVCPSGTAQVGVPYSSALVATGGEPPYTYSIITGSLPPGLTLNPSTGAITGTPTTYGSYTFTAQVVDSRNNSAGTTTASCTIVVAPPALTLVCPSGTAQVGVPYSSALVATGGEPPYTYSIITGSLPPGLTLNPSTGAITGTPTTYGSYTFTAQVVDSRNNSAGTTTASCTIVVAPPALTLVCPSGTAQVGVPYSSALVATGGEPPYTYSIITGSLPPGLTLNPSTGAITGTPTTYGTYTFTAQVVDSRNNSAGTTTASCTIVVAPPVLTLVCPSGTAQVGVPYSSALVATGGEPPYTFSIITGSLPPGLTLNPSTGAITGTPTTYGSYTFTAQVVDSRNNSAGTTTASCTIVVAPPALTLVCPSGTAQVGVPYSSALVATGGEPPYTYSIITGSLPPGLTLNPSTGAITGTPTTYGSYTFTAQVVDSRNNSAGTTTASCTIVVAPPTLTLVCPSGTAQVGVPYSSALVATGGEPPYTYSIITGSLPPGLTLNPSTGAITGTPTTYGSYTFTAQVVDSRNNSAGTTTASCTIVVAPPALTLVCPSGTAQVGVPYSSALVATGGEPPYTYSIITGSLPPGLTLNPSTGAITGTPTTYGSYTFTAQVVDSRNNSAGTTTASCTIVVAPPALTLVCSSGTAQVGVPYSSALVATGGEPPYTYSIITGSLPPGLTLNLSTGAITGTPTTYGSYTFTAQVVDSRNNSAGTTTASCTIVVAPPTITLTCPTSTGQVGVVYSSALVATGGAPPYTFSIISGSLPPGLTLNPSTGAITGTPTTYGTYTFTAQVVDSRNNSAGTATASCTIVISPPQLTMTCGTNTVGEVGVAFDSGPMNVTGGAPPYTFSIVGTLPTGLTLNTSTGEVTGTPTTAGTFQVKVTDSQGNTATNCMITIKGPLNVVCGSNSIGEVGVAFDSGPMTVTGGLAPYTFSIVGTLPTGLTLNTSTGDVSGTPTTAGSFQIKVTDSLGNSSLNCTITINGPLQITCGKNNIGEVGVAFDSGPMMVTGGVTPYTFSIVGTLPTGLTLNTSTGEVSGTPTVAGSFQIEVTDSLGNTSTNCTITIYGPLQITCGKNNIGEVGVAFDSGPMMVMGGVPPYTFSIVGTLPAGLTLNTSTGEITGTPTAAGSFQIEVTDSLGNSSTSCTITIYGPLQVVCGKNDIGEVGVAFDSGPMTVTGGAPPYTFSIVGTLPTGLTLNTSTGEISGTPTTAGTFSIEVTDSLGNSSTTCSITINGPLQVVCGANNVGTTGVAFDSGPMTVTGGTPPYTFSIVGTLPTGLTLNTSTGDVSGTPTSTGSFQIEVTDSLGNSSTNCTITINAPACAAGAPGLNLGTDSSYIFIDTGATHLGWNAYQLDGNVLFGQGLTVQLSGGNDGGLGAGYSVYLDPTVNLSGNLQNPLTFVSVPTSLTAAAAATAQSVSNYAKGLTATQTFSTINNNQTINGNGGLNVINVGNVQNATLTINGSAKDFFIFNVSGQIQTNRVMTLTGGVTASHILWNLTGTGTVLQTSGGDVLVGTFLATDGGAFQFSELQLNGELIITDGNVQLVSGNHTLTQSGFGCSGN